MFRVSRFMREILHPTAPGPRRDPPGPVVIWNLVRRCNLTCMHCYSISADIDFPGELSTPEVLGVMEDLRAYGVPALRAFRKSIYTRAITPGTIPALVKFISNSYSPCPTAVSLARKQWALKAWRNASMS